MFMDDTFMDEMMCMDDTYVTWMEMRIMCMDEIIAYDCCVWLYISTIMCICVIFQFKTDVKLKYGCVEPLIHINFRWLLKTAKNSPIISLAASRKPSKIDQKYFQRPRNFWWFCVVIFSGQGIFGDRFEPPKISLFLAKKPPKIALTFG
jgi:hypothetical protein